MSTEQHVYIGTDGGATTSKVGAVWRDGSPVSTSLLQWPTNTHEGPDAVIRGWVEAITEYLSQNGLAWDLVQGVGLSTPGPFRSYGVFDRLANLPESFTGFDVLTAYSSALAARAGRAVPVAVGNDGNTLNGMEASHMPAPLHELHAPAYPCGCGRTWGCVEVYTSIAGLPYLLADKLAEERDHELARSTLDMKARVLALRGLAQQGDRLAGAIFDFQARALGLHVANLVMALDPEFVVIGGGLMDPEATPATFRERYLRIVHDTALPYLWPPQRSRLRIVPATLGDLSQAIGAALLALYQSRRVTT